MGRLSRILTGGLEVIDLEEGGIDLFVFEDCAQTFKDLGFHDHINLMCLWILDPERIPSYLCNRLSLLQSKNGHGR